MANKALNFDGDNDYVDLNYGVGAALNGAPAITFEAWLKNDTLPGGTDLMFIFGTRIGGAFAGLDVYFRGETLRIGGRSKQADTYQKDDTPFTATGAWKYIVGILDFANDRIKISIDGSEVLNEAVTFGNATYTLGTPNQEDRLGITPAMTAGQYFDGIIDEVRISKVGRTTGEITATWNGGSGKRFVPDANTVAIWHMDEGAGNKIFDVSASGNDGTIFGASWADGFAFSNPAEVLRPNATGDENAIASQTPADAFPATDHWNKVDEVTSDSFTTSVWNENTDAFERDLYNIADHSVGSGTINFIKVYIVVYGDGGDNDKAKVCIKSGGTADEGSEEGPLIELWASYSHQWNTPPEGGSWDWDKIDALQIGVSLQSTSALGGTTVLCTQVYVEVDYTPVAGWTGKVMGVTNPGKICGVEVANIAKVCGVA